MSLSTLSKTLIRSRSARSKRTRKASRRAVRSRRLRCEAPEARTLLSVSSISGTVFEDLDADGVQDAGELGLAGWNVVLEQADIDTPLLEIPNPSGMAEESLAFSMVSMGNNILAGAHIADRNGVADAGVVYLLDGTTSALLHTFSHPAPSPGDNFGKHVSAYGDRILAGAVNDDTDGTDTGMAFVYDREGELLHTLHNPIPELNDRFGGLLAISGDQALVGAHKKDSGATDAGAAYLFDLSSGALLHTYLNPTPEAQDYFAIRLGLLDNGNLAISSFRDDLEAVNSGAVYVYDPATATTSDAGGNYGFTGLSPGDYVVSQIVKAGFVQTTPGGDGTDSVTMAAGEDVTGLDFGNYFDAVLLFSDSFENGEWNGRWFEDSQNDWFTSAQRATDGSYSAEVDGRASNATLTVANSFDLTPYGSVELKFDWFIESGLDSGEYLAVDVFDGTNWTEVAKLAGNVDPENTWHQEIVDISAAQLVDDFQFRFRAKMNKSDEDANVDNVELIATRPASRARCSWT